MWELFVLMEVVLRLFMKAIRNIVFDVEQKERFFNMLVSDLFKALDDTQDVDIYIRKTGVYIFSGESRDITSSCLELHVNKLFVNNDSLVIEVE